MNTMPVVVPPLDIDKILFNDRPMPDHCRVDRLAVATLITHLQTRGFELDGVHDGDGYTKTPTMKEAMELIFNLDVSGLHVKKPGFKRRWVGIILGNGDGECAYDHSDPEDKTDGFAAAMDEFYEYEFTTPKETVVVTLVPGITPKF